MGLFGFGKDKDSSPPQGIQESQRPVSEKMIWICEKCGFKLADNDNDNIARGIQKAVKSLISDKKRKREVRAMTSSCLNVCPAGKIAAGIADLKNGGVRFIEFDYKGDVDKAAEKLYQLL